MPQTCSWWRSKPSFQSMEANKSFHRFQQASGKDLQGKEGKKTQTLAVRSLGSSRWSLWRCCVPMPWGENGSRSSVRRNEPASTSGSDCSHPSGMPADGFSRRPRRQLEGFAAEPSFLLHRQSPCPWHWALQLHKAWHEPAGMILPLPPTRSSHGILLHPLSRKSWEIGTTGQTTGNTAFSGTEGTCCTAHARDSGTQRRGVDLALECKCCVPAVPHHWLT